jgi:hypothetical protein
LHYNVSPSYSVVVGNSLKYNTSTAGTLNVNTLWKFYQNKQTNGAVTAPAHLLISPTDSVGVTNFLDFTKVGLQNNLDATAFKKIQYFTKTNPQLLFSNVSDYSLRYSKLSNLYFNDNQFLESNSYGTYRQHNFITAKTLTNGFGPKIDTQNLKKYFEYNFDYYNQNNNTPQTVGTSFFYQRDDVLHFNAKLLEWDSILKDGNKISYKNFIKYPSKAALFNAEVDGKHFKNIFKYGFNLSHMKKNFLADK